MWEGNVVSVHIAPEMSAPMQSIAEARACPGRGLEGDRYFSGPGFTRKSRAMAGGKSRSSRLRPSRRFWAACSTLRGRLGVKLAAVETRRNIATSGVPLNHLVDREFWVGAALLRGTRLAG
jgi:hypothetical protein